MNYDMDPDGVTNGIGQFRDAADTFRSQWENHKNALNSGVSALGNDVITQAFLSQYKPLAEQLMGSNDAIPGHFHNLCDDMQSCVDEYNAADTSGAAEMNRVAGSGLDDAPNLG